MLLSPYLPPSPSPPPQTFYMCVCIYIFSKKNEKHLKNIQNKEEELIKIYIVSEKGIYALVRHISMSLYLFSYSIIHQIFSKRLSLFQLCYRDWSFTEEKGSHGAYIPVEKQTNKQSYKAG